VPDLKGVFNKHSVEQSKAKIFLAGERGCMQDDNSRSYAIFNDEHFHNPYKNPFDALRSLHDETIAAGCSKTYHADSNKYIAILPVVGTLLCKTNGMKWLIVTPGQLQGLQLQRGDSFEILNCYQEELVDFIIAGISDTDPRRLKSKELFTFNFEENSNELISIRSSYDHDTGPFFAIGKFAGRHEASYELERQQNHLFVFVIEGVFEVNGRLLHPRDGPALWNVEGEVSLESLSEGAVIFFIEMVAQ
jgi:hypothetical protein